MNLFKRVFHFNWSSTVFDYRLFSNYQFILFNHKIWKFWYEMTFSIDWGSSNTNVFVLYDCISFWVFLKQSSSLAKVYSKFDDDVANRLTIVLGITSQKQKFLVMNYPFEFFILSCKWCNISPDFLRCFQVYKLTLLRFS